MAGKVGIIILALLAVWLPGAVLRIDPATSEALEIHDSGTDMELDLPFEAPKNIKIELYPDISAPVSVKISWDPVAGARSYRVFTCVAVADSSQMIPVKVPIVIDGNIVWLYLYDKHPIFGEPMIERLNSESAPMISYTWGYGNGSRGRVAKFSAWELDTAGVMSGTSYIRPLNGERDRFFCVRAVR